MRFTNGYKNRLGTVDSQEKCFSRCSGISHYLAASMSANDCYCHHHYNGIEAFTPVNDTNYNSTIIETCTENNTFHNFFSEPRNDSLELKTIPSVNISSLGIVIGSNRHRNYGPLCIDEYFSAFEVSSKFKCNSN